eukprot:scaffold8.g1469.t1
MVGGRIQQPGSEQDPRQLVSQCLEAAQPTAEAQRQLLQLGLEATEAGRPQPDDIGAGGPPGASAGGGADRQWWRWQRLLVLQHLERLDTVLALYKGAFSPEAYRQLRDCTVSEAAAAFAAVQRWEELGVLLARHPYALMPSVLDALAAAPETADPKALAPLLAQLASARQAPALARPADWAEAPATVEELRAAERYSLLLATEPTAALSVGWRPPSARQLAAWVCARALALEATTGQLAAAMALLEAGRAAVHYGEQPLNELLEAAHQLSAILRLAASRSGGDGGGGAAGGSGSDDEGGGGPAGAAAAAAAWQMRLRDFSTLEPAARLQALLVLVGTETLASDLGAVVAPFLGRMDGQDTNLLLRQAEAEQRCLFDSATELAKAAAAACYGAAATDAWGLLEAALSAAWEAVRADDGLSHEEAEAAREMLNGVSEEGAALASLLVRGHLTAARLLTKHGLATQARMVRDANRPAAEGLVRTLLARVSRAKNSESRWVEVWMDLRTAQERGLGQLSEASVRSELCATLLRCGHFRLAESYLRGLEPARAERLVVAAGRDCFLSATGLADKAVQQAQECLSVLPDSAAARHELSGVRAALRLRDLGVQLAPIQLHQLRQLGAEGSQRLLEQILASNPRLAQDADSVMQLAEIVGGSGSRSQLLLRAAVAALGGGDVGQAEGIALQLVRHRHAPAWELAAAVAGHYGCSSPASRLQLLSFALLHAPAQQLPALLAAWESMDEAGASAPCWLRPGGEEPSSLQGTLEAQLSRYFEPSRSSSSASPASSPASSNSPAAPCGSAGASKPGGPGPDVVATLSCLLALGRPGLQRWEALLSQHQQQLSYPRRRQALLVGLTAALLLALQPSSMDASSPEAVVRHVEAAQHLLALLPAELLSRWQEGGLAGSTSPAASKLSRVVSEGERSQTPSELNSDAGDAASSGGTPQEQQHCALEAAAGEAAERFLAQLVSVADAQRLARLLPGVDAAAALAASSSDPEARRVVVLKLAAAAARPGSTSGPVDVAQLVLSPSQSGAPNSRSFKPAGSSFSGRGSSARPPPPDDAAQPSPAESGGKKKTEEAADAGGGPTWSSQLDGDRAAAMLRDALQLGQRYAVPGWEVRLAFLQSLLLHNQEAGEQEAVEALLRQAWPALLQEPAAAGAALAMLLHVAWPAAASRTSGHLRLCLRLMGECCAALGAAAPGQGAAWDQAAAVLGGCATVAGSLHAAMPALDAKPFLQPPLLPLDDWAASCLAASGEPTSQQGSALGPPRTGAELAQLLLPHLSPENVMPAAQAVGVLGQQQEAASALSGSGAGAAYPLAPSDVLGVLACKLLAEGDATMQHVSALFPHMAPDLTAAVAAFATTSGPCPLGLPLAAPALEDRPKEQLLAAALQALDASAAADAPAASDAALVRRLRRQHALLATLARVQAAAGSKLSSAQLRAVRRGAELVQEAADGEAGVEAAESCLGGLLVAGCDALAVLSVAFELAGLLERPPPSPRAADAAAGGERQQQQQQQQGAPDPSLQLVHGAAAAALAAVLSAMGGGGGEGPSSAQQPLSAGDAIQNLFGLMRALDAPSAHLVPAAGPAVDSLRLLVLELLGSLGTGLWAGWAPPPAEAAALASEGAGFNQQRALLLARVAATLAAADWPEAAQQAGLSADDCASSAAAEAAVLRLVEAAAGPEQLQAVVAVLQQVLQDAFPATAAAGEEQDEPGAAAAALAPAEHPLHRAWSACLHALLRQRQLAPALAALDGSAAEREAQPGRGRASIVTQQEAESLVQAADASLGPAAAAALAALVPYAHLRRAAQQQLLEAVGGSGASAAGLADMPGMGPLLLALAAETAQPLLPRLAAAPSQQRAFQQLCTALLQHEDAALRADLGAHLTLRAAAVACLAAQLVAERQYTAAGWLAMQFAGLHPLLRVLGNSARVLRQVLQACSSARRAGTAAASAELSPELAAAVGPAHLAEHLLHGLPQRCDAALEQLAADQQ